MAISSMSGTRVLQGKDAKFKKKLGSVKPKGELRKMKKEYLPKRKRLEAKARIDAAEDTSSDNENAHEKEGNEIEHSFDSHDDVKVKKHKIDSDEAEGDVDSEEEGKPDSGNPGWADAMAKVLSIRPKVGQPVVLAKARTDRQIAAKLNKKTDEFEIEPVVGASTEMATKKSKKVRKIKTKIDDLTPKEARKELEKRRLLKKNFNNQGRVKPDITKKDFERQLLRIATKGVVQLFNAVKTQQATVKQEVSTVGGSEVKREKVMQSMTKGMFLDAINSKGKSVPVTTSMTKSRKSVGPSAEDNVKPTWNILRDDYMMGASVKDWDKQSDSDEAKDTKPKSKRAKAAAV